MMGKGFYNGLLILAFLVVGPQSISGQDFIPSGLPARTEIHDADSMLNISIAKLNAGVPAEAMDMAGKAYNMASRVDYHEGMGDALMIMGEIDLLNKKSGMALRNFFTAMREYEWVGSLVKQSGAARAIADIFWSAGLHEKAVEYYLKALELGDKDLSAIDQAALKENIALAYLDLHHFEKALDIYRDLYAFYKEIGNSIQEVSALNQLTYCLNELKKYEEAHRYNIEVLELSRRKGDKGEEMAALNNLGYSYKYLGDMEKALNYFRQAADLGISINAPVEEVTVVFTNMAVIYQNEGRNAESMDYFTRAERMADKAGANNELARIRHLIAMTYYIQKDYHNAGSYNRDALGLALKTGNAELAAMTYLTSSNISAALYDYESSLEAYRLYLDIRDSLLRAEQGLKQDLSQQQYMVEKTEKELDEMIYSRQFERMELGRLRLESEKNEQELELMKKTADLQKAAILNQELEKNRALQELLLAEERLAMERKDREIKDLKVLQQLQESELRRGELEQIRQNQEIQVLTQEKQITELSLQKVRTRNRFLAGVILLALVTLVIIYRSWRFTRKTNKILSNQRNKIQQQKEAIESQYDLIKIEREKSEKLLLNILPEETAAELKEKGYASPQHYDRVTVLFTDFVGFTQVSEKMTPQELLQELDYCFYGFDKIIDKHNLEKIKTIGDSYMCAGGIPVANETNPFDVVSAALEIRDFMEQERKARELKGQDYWNLRIGVHTGPVVAGVVGKNKFAYDIWGDAVNTASRMESSGEAGKVNISGGTYHIVKDHFNCSYRGKIKAKNKGEVDMYFVEGLK